MWLVDFLPDLGITEEGIDLPVSQKSLEKSLNHSGSLFSLQESKELDYDIKYLLEPLS